MAWGRTKSGTISLWQLRFHFPSHSPRRPSALPDSWASRSTSCASKPLRSMSDPEMRTIAIMASPKPWIGSTPTSLRSSIRAWLRSSPKPSKPTSGDPARRSLVGGSAGAGGFGAGISPAPARHLSERFQPKRPPNSARCGPDDQCGACRGVWERVPLSPLHRTTQGLRRQRHPGVDGKQRRFDGACRSVAEDPARGSRRGITTRHDSLTLRSRTMKESS